MTTNSGERAPYIASKADLEEGVFYCLPHEREELDVELQEISANREGLAEEAAQAMGESSETWHDNAPAEAVFAEMYGLDSREAALVKAIRFLRNVEYPTPDIDFVTIGSRVHCDVDGDEFMLDIVGNIPIRRPLTEIETGSVAAPLPQALLGCKQGETVSAILPNNTVLKITALAIDQIAQSQEKLIL